MSEVKNAFPFVALPTWIFKWQIENPGWLSSKEIVVLLALQSFADGIREDSTVYPSIERLCLMTSLSKRTIIETVKSLEEKQLLSKTTRYEKGERKTNIYTLKIWNYDSPLQNKAVSSPSQGCESLSAESAPTPDPKCKNRPTLSAGFAPKQEPLTKNHIYPPVSPLPLSAPASPTTQTNRFRATEAIVPIALHPVSDLLCSFFNEHKSGAKTRKAFDGLILQLTKILEDKGGGMSHVKKQLDTAIQKSQMGEKKWNSITYDNWEKFGKAKTPAWQINNRPSTETVAAIFEEDAASSLFNF